MTPSTKQELHLPGFLHDILERHLEEDVELPILPEAAARIAALCEDETANARSIEKVLEREPSLAAHVLRIANSAAFAPKEPIVSLRQAVSRLGLFALRNIVLAISLQSRVFKVQGHQGLVRTIWTHCAVAAVFAREIARKLRKDVEGAFLCGLLHDVARPVVLQATIDALAHRSKEPLPAALLETAMNEFHESVAERMLADWQLADWMVAVVAHHHEPAKAAPHDAEARIVRLADLMAHWALDGDQSPQDFDASVPVIGELGLSAKDVEALLACRVQSLEFAEALQPTA